MAALPEPIDPGEAEQDNAEPDLTERPSQRLARSADLLGRSDSACRKWLRKRFDAIAKGFEDQGTRADNQDQWWNCYNCELDDSQFYNGNAEVYVPIIRDAINARTTRFSNQAFPQSGRYVDVTSTDGSTPYEIVALINYYIKAAQFKTSVVKPMLRNGDIEGQYNLLVGWETFDRQIVSRETRGVMVGGIETDGAPEEIVDIREEDVTEGRPVFTVLHDADVLILPATADSVEQALQIGGSVTIVWRWSKEKLKQMASAGEIEGKYGEDTDLLVNAPTMAGLTDQAKKLARDVGIRVKGPHTIAFETWQMMPQNEKGAFKEDGAMRLCKTWYNLEREPIGAKRNPFWNDRCPLLSVPVEKMAGVVKGKSLVEPIAEIQYEANNAANERADVDHYSAMPIIRQSPQEGNPPLILAPAAVWSAGKGDIEFLTFPDMSARARARVQDATTIIFQSLGVNPAMLPQQSGGAGKKRNQAEVAMEQQVDLLTTAEAVDVLDEGILTPAAEWMIDLDHQFRDRDLTIRMFGELGIRAEMETVKPLQNRHQYSFQWCGAQQARLNVAMQQQGTAFINILRGMRQDIEAEGLKLRIAPFLQRQALSIFGAVDGPLILEDPRHTLTIDPDVENEMLAEGHMVPIHPMDQDQEHLQKHQQAMQMGGDPSGTLRIHIAAHVQQMTMKNAAMMQKMLGQQTQPPGAPGVAGGAGPGVSGTPRPPVQGAQPAGPRLIKGPPGQVPPESMPRHGAVMPPRRF
jgi:hypothetical protein